MLLAEGTFTILHILKRKPWQCDMYYQAMMYDQQQVIDLYQTKSTELL